MMIAREQPMGSFPPLKKPLQWLLDLILVGLFLGSYALRSNILIDDAGFILRYLSHVPEGCFFCFNVEDGPVFGLSGFVHGLVGSLFVLLGASPKMAVWLSNGIGFVLSIWFVLALLRRAIPYWPLVYLAAAGLLLANQAYLLVAFQGMETPIHLAIVLAALLAFLDKKQWWMWGLLALSAISKLDAVPMILVVAGLHFRREMSSFLTFRRKVWAPLLLAGVLPILIWIGLATLIFGSPLPQSAYAKAFLLFHPDHHWFPFLENYLISPFKLILLLGFVGVFLAHLFMLIRKKEWQELDMLIFGLAFIGTLILYYFYNPGERMLWYYALPNLLMLLQIFVSISRLSALLIPKGSFWLLFCGFLFFAGLSGFRYGKEIGDYDGYMNAVEGERMATGDWINESASASDTLFSSHGHTSAFFPGYVVDLTGLNSRLATDFELDREKLLIAHRPHWIVDHSWLTETDLYNRNHLQPDTSFYNIEAFGYPVWQIWRRPEKGEGMARRRVSPLQVQTFGAELIDENERILLMGDSARIQFRKDENKVSSLSFAVPTASPVRIELRTQEGKREIRPQQLPPANYPQHFARVRIDTQGFLFGPEVELWLFGAGDTLCVAPWMEEPAW